MLFDRSPRPGGRGGRAAVLAALLLGLAAPGAAGALLQEEPPPAPAREEPQERPAEELPRPAVGEPEPRDARVSLGLEVPPPEEEEERPWGQSHLYKELNLSIFYSREGVPHLPPDIEGTDHVQFSPRFPRNLIGVEYVATFTDDASINRLLGGRVRLGAVDLHPRLEYDPTEETDDNDRFKFVAQDFWARLEFPDVPGLSWRVGQVTIPYGVNPIMAPRGDFLLPLEAFDTGGKWEWGSVLRGPAWIYEWEIGTTIGTGMQFHSPRLFSDDRSYMLSAAFRGPTMHEFQYGISGMYGEIPDLMIDRRLTKEPISRWRVGLDAFWKHKANTIVMGQAIFGQDGFRGDAGKTFGMDEHANNVLGGMLLVDWVPPFGSTHEAKRKWQNWAVAAQFVTLWNDLKVHRSDDTFTTLELRYSLSDKITLRLDWQHDFHTASMGGVEDDRVWFTFYYYGL